MSKGKATLWRKWKTTVKRNISSIELTTFRGSCRFLLYHKEVIAEIKIQKDKLELYKEEVETAKYLIRSRQKIESDIDFYHSRLNDIKLETEVSEFWLEKYNTKLDVLKGHLATLERSVEDWSKKAEKSENDALKLLKTANDIKTDNKKLEIKNIELKKEFEPPTTLVVGGSNWQA